MVTKPHGKEERRIWRVRQAVGVVLAVHGLVHLLGFAAYLRLAEPQGISYPTSLLDGHLPAPSALVQLLGVLWLVAAGGFVASGLAVFLRRSWWRPVALATALLSFALGVLGWSDARVGVLVNAVILAALLVGPRLLPSQRLWGDDGTEGTR